MVPDQLEYGEPAFVEYDRGSPSIKQERIGSDATAIAKVGEIIAVVRNQARLIASSDSSRFRFRGGTLDCY